MIPVAGIRGQDEQEIRAASSLLAVMGAVDEFGKALLKEIGAPGGKISTFTEIPLEDPDGKVWRPDGAIKVKLGKREWKCLVEVKTNNVPLPAEQISTYLDLAKEQGFQAVLTISNQISSSPTEVPVSVDRRKLRKVDLRHLSWWRILTEAVMQYQHRGVRDPEQAWILGELIAYLEHEKSGAIGFEDMGQNWVQVRNAARDGTIRAGDAGVRDVVDRWEQFVEYLCLGLSQDLGVEVISAKSKARDGRAWTEELSRRLEAEGILSGSFRVPGAVGPIEVEADLRERLTRVNVNVSAPKEGRALTRVNWILRQLRKAPDDLRIEVRFARTRESTALLLGDARVNPKKLLSPSDPKREPRSFALSLARPLGTRRGKGERSFVIETRRQVVSFYADLVEGLTDWHPKAPKMSNKSTEESGDPRHVLSDAPETAQVQAEPKGNLPVPPVPSPTWSPPTP
ncbi:MAG: stress response protein [Solirubrobacterales bacterium]